MCTTIKIDYPGGSVMGRNMDWDMDVRYHIMYMPPGFEYAKDLYGNPLTSRYRALGICFHTFNPLKDGVNEHGLMGSTNMYLQLNLFGSKVDPGKTNLSSLDYFNYALGSYRSVRELVEDLPNLHISKKDHAGHKVICPDFHYYFIDAAGDSVLIEPRDQVLQAVENPYGVMTNSPSLGHHARALEKTFASEGRQFHVAKDLPGGYDPVSRFVKAYHLKQNIAEPKTMQGALENTYSLLEAMKIPEGFTKTEYDYTFTRYTCAYDSRTRLLTVRSHMNPKVYSLSLNEVAHLTEKTLISVPRGLELAPIEV